MTILKQWRLFENRIVKYRLRFSFLFFLSLFTLCFQISVLNAAGIKSNGDIQITDDIFGISGSGIDLSNGIYSAQGFIGNLASGEAAGTPNIVESGFYSKLVSSPSIYSYNSVTTGSFKNIWTASNPLATDYQIFLSTNDAIEDYFMLYETTEAFKSLGGLIPNTTYSAFIFANYMDSDISQVVSTAAVTLAVPVSSDTFILKDIGFESAELLFSSFENPGPSKYNHPWQIFGTGLPQALYGHSSLTYDGYAYVSGGFDGVNFSSAIYQSQIDAAGNLGAWNLAGYMPDARYGHKILAAKGRLYAIGGYNSGGTQNSVYSVSISSLAKLGEWSAETNLAEAVYFHSAVQYEGKIYVSGGYSSSVSAGVYKADIAPDGTLSSWTALINMPDARYAHTMNVIGDYIFVIGGKDGANAKTNVWKTQVQADGSISAWSALASLPSSRYAHETVSIGNNFYVSGGNNGTSAQNIVFQGAVATGGNISGWSSFNSLLELKQFHSGFAIGGKMYVLGGTDGSSVVSQVYLSSVTGTEYKIEVSTDAGFATLSDESYWQPDYNWSFNSLSPSSTYYFRAKSRNWNLEETAYSDYISTLTYAAIPSTAPWTNVSISSGIAAWQANNNPVGALYSCDISSYSDFSIIADSSDTYNETALFTGLEPSTTYYARVKAFNPIDKPTRYARLPDMKTLFDPALDTSSPTITNNQIGDDIWRSTRSALYNIDFADAGGSEILKFQVMAATDTGGLSGIVAAWTDVAANIDQPSYTDDWNLPFSVWDAMVEGATNYISVKVYDNVLNSSTSIDAFYILKDTTVPSISVDYTAPTEWLSDNPGPVSTITFSDAVSKLFKTQYSISSNQLSQDGNVLDWTDIGDPENFTVFEATWSYNFSLLVNGTNYFSVRAIDIAGSTNTVADAFNILKNVSGPMVNIVSPSEIYLSTLTLVSGVAVETASHPVVGTEISFMDKDSSLYWNGVSFNSNSRIWHVASGTDTFTLDISLSLADAGQYEIVARSSDSAGDYSMSYSTFVFTCDTTPPTAGIISPVNGSDANSLSSIFGTASDVSANVSSVNIMLKQISDDFWWNGGNWQGAPLPLASGTTAEWTFYISEILAASLKDGASYYATVRAADDAFPSNKGDFYLSGATFTYYDTTNPGAVSDVSSFAGTLPGSMNLSWSAPGDNGLSGFLLDGNFAIEYSTYSGAVFSTSTAQIIVSTSTLVAGATCLHTISGLDSATTYYFVLWTEDDAGNWSGLSNVASAVSGMANIGSVSGNIKQSSNQPINGVLVEAYDGGGNLISSDYTDSNGDYSVENLDDAVYTIKAIWSANDIESWVSKAGIQSGSIGIDFVLNTDYLLASISGYIPLGFKSAYSVSSSKYAVKSAVLDNEEMFIEVYQRGRRVVLAEIDKSGRFNISNLLPGTYSIRAFNGREFTDMQNIYLKDGEVFAFTPKWYILSKDTVYAYPNPAQNNINIHFETNASLGYEVSIIIFDITGRVIKKFGGADINSVASGQYEVIWDFSNENIASGVYLYMVKVKDAAGDSKKIIKKMAIIR